VPTGSRRLKFRENQTYRGAQAYRVGRVGRWRGGGVETSFGEERERERRTGEREGEGGREGGREKNTRLINMK
jgi:hypothetical protein